MTYIAMTHHKYPCPVVDEIYNFGILFLGHYYCTFSLSESCPTVEKQMFNEKYQFHAFYLKITSL